MAIILDSIIYDVLATVIFICMFLYLYFTSTFNYWKDRGIPYLKPVPVFGNIKDLFMGTKHLCDVYQEYYDTIKGERFVGLFEVRDPALMITDPYLIDHILIKDFDHFSNRGFSCDTENDPLVANLFTMRGILWRNLRNRLMPTFSMAKLKCMFNQINKCGDNLIKYIEESSKTNKAIESNHIIEQFTLEVIFSVAFGMNLEEDNEERKKFCETLGQVFKPTKMMKLRFAIIQSFPKLSYMFGLKHFSKYFENIIMSFTTATLNYRRENNVERNDFLQLMLNIQKQEQDGRLTFQENLDRYPGDTYDQTGCERAEQLQQKFKGLVTDEVIAAHALVFFSAGSDSTTSAIIFTLYLLTQNSEVQKKVQDELDSVLSRNRNEWSYQAVKELVYLDQVIQETQRIYPSAPVLFRMCNKSYKVPGSKLVIEEGVRVSIPVMAIQNDPQYYNSPQEFNPDRFHGNNFKANSIFLPFGNGPRVCIAMRFAVMEVKIVLARILEQYLVKLSPKTKLPITYNKTSFSMVPENRFWFEFDKRVK